MYICFSTSDQFMAKPIRTRREEWHRIIFGFNTAAGRTFDVILLVAIILSVLAVFLESVTEIESKHRWIFVVLEWGFTVLFTIEYIARLWVARKPFRYMTSFFGVVDLLSILPTYISLLLPGTHYLLTIRILRVIRVFRIFKLAGHLKESHMIVAALYASRKKLTVFLTTVLLLVIIIGSIMYVIEAGSNSGFDNIPRSIYWAIVTLTTVGYGDISPATPLGQFLAAVVMILGYAIIAVPTGIVSVAISRMEPEREPDGDHRVCKHCDSEGHYTEAVFCFQCGRPLKIKSS